MEKYFKKVDLENAFDIGVHNSKINNLHTFDSFNDYFKELEKYGAIGYEMFSKEDVENILKQFIKENSTTPKIDVGLVEEFIEDYINYINYNSKKEVIEELLPVSYGLIKLTCGWSKWCDVVGGNHYMVNEWGHYDDNHLLYCNREQFEKLFEN